MVRMLPLEDSGDGSAARCGNLSVLYGFHSIAFPIVAAMWAIMASVRPG